MRKLLIVLSLIVQFAAGLAHAGAYEEAVLAARDGRIADIAALLQRGLDPNTADRDGTTLLGMAARAGDVPLVDLLLQYRASANRRNSFGDTPLLLATIQGHLDIVKRLHSAGGDLEPPGWSALHYAAFGGHLALVEYVLNAKVDINRRAPNQRTALMLAAQIGNPAVVKLLLEKGADKRIVDTDGLSAAQIARKQGFEEIAQSIEAAPIATQ